MSELRTKLVETALESEQRFGNAPAITSALSPLDAAMLVACSADEYSRAMTGMTAVQRGYDFKFKGARYQVEGNRPSGKRGSTVTLGPKATNYEWDFPVWVLYNHSYEI